MKKLISSLCLLLAPFSAIAEESVAHVFGDNVFSIQLPKSWVNNNDRKYFSFSSPDKRVSLTASAYAKEGGNLEEFSNYRFSSVHDWYKPTSQVKKLKTEKISVIYREFEGVWPGETKPTFYVVACANLGKAYASITFTTDRQDFLANQNRYVQILRSVQPGS
ncbi:hypothetical protein [Quatrionicoccus australiensis]|uniref:hypothetical protein n=1 Tax=Quatrionicoccus australiensis TaxID=138118 RepID=UPI001CF82805|nr:hypothetical protein [Quatrionicoccus australiensis]UCV16429.1 hypothetical protein KI612_06960 [Quatrionicoccus australiensis]